MLASYAKLFAVPGAIRFSAAGIVARVPTTMLSLAIILPISKLTGSYATAGAVSASTALGFGLAAPVSGRLTDRFGQRAVLLRASLLHFVSLVGLVSAARFGAPVFVLCAAAVAVGMFRVSISAMVRTRWAHVLRASSGAVDRGDGRSPLLQTAYAFESVIDEVIYISAPVLATFLATSVHDFAALGCCLVLSLVGATSLAAQRATEPPASARRKSGSAWSVPGLPLVALTMAFIGASAGAVDVVVIARADGFGSRPLAGALLAALALSSMVSGFWFGARTWTVAPRVLWRRCLLLLVIGLLPLVFARSLTTLAIAMLVAGLAIAPTSIAAMVMTERMLPPSALHEGMNVVSTAMALGVAAGTSLTGVVVDHCNPALAPCAPFLLTLLATLTPTREPPGSTAKES